MDPISAPLARVRNVNLVTERLAVRNTTLSDTNGTIVPGGFIQKHAMVMERTGSVKVVGRMDNESIIDADGDRRRARSLCIRMEGEHKRGRGKRLTAKYH